jgi:putative membrane protein
MKRPLLFAALASLVIVGCTSRDNADVAGQDATPPAASADTSVPDADAPAMARQDPNAVEGDDIALGLLGAVNENEIAAAKQAQEKKVSGAVLDYAKMMEKEHSENLEKTKSLGTLSSASEVQLVKDHGAQEAATLDSKSGKAYAAAYIDAMVAGHQDALSMIDNKMLPAATSEPVKQHLTDTRKHVEAHLKRAQEIKKAM